MNASQRNRSSNVQVTRLAFRISGTQEGTVAFDGHPFDPRKPSPAISSAAGLAGQQQSIAAHRPHHSDLWIDAGVGVVENGRKEKQLWIPLFLAGLIAGLMLRFYLASMAEMPGHGDSAFYYTVAKNIADGRGPVVDYIVYFFNGLLPLPHYAGDFWNPSASFLIAVPLMLFGKTISNALIAPIAAGIVPAVAGYLAGKKYSQSTAAGALVGILTFFSPFQVWFSVTTEAIIFAGAFGSIAIYLMMRGSESARYFLIAAIFTGLANLIRQDNILLLGALESCILLASISWKRKLTIAAATLLIHLVVLTPLLAENYAQLHAVFPSGPGKTAFLTTYEDFHSYNKRIDWYTLRATWGIQGILKRRLHTASENLGQVDYFLNPIFSSLILIALADVLLLHRSKRKLQMLLPAFVFAILEYLFYTFVASFSGPGSLIKSLGTLMPFICIVIVDWLLTYLHAKPLLIGAVLLLSVYGGYEGFERNSSSTLYYNEMYKAYGVVKTIVLEDAAQRGMDVHQIVVLARDTWDVYEGTGFKSVMVPNNDINTIIQVAQHYNAHYILLPAKRPQLDKIYTGLGPDPRFHFVGSVPNSAMKLFWIDFVK